MDNTLIFEQKGYPTIKVYDKHFEIKSTDVEKYRKFNYSDLKEVKIIDFKKSIWFKLFYNSFAKMLSENEPLKLKVVKKNNGSWDYLTSSKYNSDFNRVIEEINLKIV